MYLEGNLVLFNRRNTKKTSTNFKNSTRKILTNPNSWKLRKTRRYVKRHCNYNNLKLNLQSSFNSSIFFLDVSYPQKANNYFSCNFQL